MTKLFIGGFPLDISELEIVQMVSLYGTVETIKIVRDRKTRICKGYAFLEMTDREGAENVMAALNKTMLAGRELTLNIVEEAPVRKAPPAFNRYTSRPDTAPNQRAKRPRKINQ